jgi:hypothetical protein
MNYREILDRSKRRAVVAGTYNPREFSLFLGFGSLLVRSLERLQTERNLLAADGLFSNLHRHSFTM